MDKLKIKSEVEAYIKIHIPAVPRNIKKEYKTKSKSPTIIHKESKTIIVSQSPK